METTSAASCCHVSMEEKTFAAAKTKSRRRRVFASTQLIGAILRVLPRHRAMSTSTDEEAGYFIDFGVVSKAEQSLARKVSGIVDSKHLALAERYSETYLTLVREEFFKIDDGLATVLADARGQRLKTRSIERFFDFLVALVDIIQDYDNDTTLFVVCNELIDKDILSTESDRAKAYQLIFIGIGLVTMLFRASLDSSENQIQLSETESSLQSHRDRTWNTTSLLLDEDKTKLLTLHDLLFQLAAHPDGPIPRPWTQNHRTEENLLSSNLSYYTLSALAGLRIQWVDSACRHLELNRRTKTLCLFRYPSYCMMLCARTSAQTTFMDRLFEKFLEENQDQSTVSAVEADFSLKIRNRKTVQSGNLFREILYTYCVLFGQQIESRKQFNHDCRTKRVSMSSKLPDPLLVQLCRESWETGPVYDGLEYGEIRLAYSPSTDFPFFAQRLNALQDYVKAQEPNNWLSLWRDRRDVNRFYTLKAAVIFGSAALVMGVLQIILSILQVVAAFKGPA